MSLKQSAMLLITVAILGGPATRARAAGDDFPVIQGKAYKFEKVAEGVYYATGGAGSNNVVIVNDRDVVLVDDGTTPAAARAFLEDIKLITNKPVSAVVNTHFHYDHTDGNSVFPPDVQIIAHEYVRNAILTFNVLDREPFKTSQSDRLPVQITSLKQQLAASDAARKTALIKELAAAETLSEQLKEVKPTPPNVTYASKMVLYKGGREIQLLFLGRGHTGGDTFRLPAAGAHCLHRRHGRRGSDRVHGRCVFRRMDRHPRCREETGFHAGAAGPWQTVSR